jgi:7,8-dihydropterin-6-yl-methyl-4-(beta-D-ribofuranosyl)aminobenzene 5'-phosphate synthase
MPTLLQAEAVVVLVLVDNVTDNLSSAPPFVESELSRLWTSGKIGALSGRCLCCAAHGLSCAITVRRGETTRTLLFDTGPDAAVFERNVERLGFDMGSVDAIMLSHGHWDHCGALLKALALVRQRRDGAAIPTHMHPGMYATRATKAADGSFRPFEDVPNPQQLAEGGAQVVHATAPQLVLGDCFFISGEIPRLTSFEIGLPGQHRRTTDGAWEPDPLIMDERYVAVAIRGKGLLVLTACSHAGVINVLEHARACMPEIPLYGVMGGFHLSGTNERAIPQTVEAMRQFGLSVIASAHCTGWRATNALAAAFGAAVVPSAVGKLFRF